MMVVVDINVLVSGVLNPHGPPGRIVDAIPLNSKGDRLRVVLTTDDGSSLTVEMRAK